jgi:hypothetical protein
MRSGKTAPQVFDTKNFPLKITGVTMMRQMTVAAILVMFLPAAGVLAQQNEADDAAPFTVESRVKGESFEPAAMRVCLTRSVRALPVVNSASDERADFIVDVIVETPGGEEGDLVAVASDLVTRLRTPSMLLDVLNPKLRPSCEDLFGMLYYYPRRALFVEQRSEVDHICGEIVDSLQARVLGPTKRFQINSGGKAPAQLPPFRSVRACASIPS